MQTLPPGPPGWYKALFWAAGLGFPFLGVAGDLEYILAAGDVCRAAVGFSGVSLRNRHTYRHTYFIET